MPKIKYQHLTISQDERDFQEEVDHLDREFYEDPDDDDD